VKKFVLLILVLISYLNIIAQKTDPHAGALTVDFSYGINQPIGILAQRFGNASSIGLGVNVFNVARGFRYGINGNYFFGSDVKEDVLAPFRTADGNILSDLNTYSSVLLRERGFYIGADIGKLFKFRSNGDYFHGISLNIGLGMLMHQIRIQNDNKDALQLKGSYTSGYDRLTMGAAIEESVAYNYISHDKTVNFFLRLEATEGLTKNQRGYNFDTHQYDTAPRLDVLLTARIGWSFALFAHFQADAAIEY